MKNYIIKGKMYRFLFRKVYSLIDEGKLVELCKVYEEEKTIDFSIQKNAEDLGINIVDIEELKCNAREIPIENVPFTFIEEVKKNDIIEEYILTTQQKDKLLLYETLFDVKREDYIT